MKRLLIVLIVIILGFISALFWWQWVNQSANIQDKTERSFVISRGESIRDVGYNLSNVGLIRSPIGFFIFVKLNNFDGKIQAGKFKLSPGMSLADTVVALTHGSVDIWVTIPEGKRAGEIGEALAAAGVSLYTPQWKQALEAKEGYLFPDTYRFPADVDLQTVIQIMQNNFSQKYQRASANPTVQLSQSDGVILASLVEREGKSASSMRTIASVLENRLAINMPLQADATIQYILGYQPVEKSWWKGSLSLDDLKIKSLYNTYLNPGLPPTPICNPGLNALTAVFHPEKTNYLYYYTDPHGVTHFAKTLDEHNANIQRFQ